MKFVIEFLAGTLSAEDISEIQSLLDSEDIELESKCLEIRCIDGINDLLPTIQVLLDSNSYMALLWAGMTKVTYAALKAGLVKLCSLLSNKKTEKITHNKAEQVPPNVILKIGKAEMHVPMDLPADKFEYCIDKFLKSVSKENKEYFATESVAILDLESGRVIFSAQNEYMRKSK